jgi:hypothetical protein
MSYNKLFCTFSQPNNLDNLIIDISTKYEVLYKKIFVFESPDTDEYICTYNVDTNNSNFVLPNTILLHRKKEHNVLFSINGLNELIKSLNNGTIDNNYPIDWSQYANQIILTQPTGLRQIHTQIHKIVNL